MPIRNVIVNESIYFITKASDHSEFVVLRNEDDPEMRGIVVLNDRYLLKKVCEGRFNTPEYYLLKTNVNEAEHIIQDAQKDGIPTLLISEDESGELNIGRVHDTHARTFVGEA